jgi:hypothetical protein
MMRIGLCQVDGSLPNLALMRIAAWHKARGDSVEWFMPLMRYEKVYASKIFTFTPEDPYLPPNAIRGGTGYDIASRLPDEIEACEPDYSIYPDFCEAIGFLTRGCVNNCPWCVVPQKEGGIRVVGDIERVAQGRKRVLLFDNNFLAAPREFILEQVGKMRRLRIRVDLNQGTDARLYDEETAAIMAGVPWIRYPRLACDTDGMIPHVLRAVRLLRKNGWRGEVFCYVLAVDGEIPSALHRIASLTAADPGIVPFVMPYRDFRSATKPSRELMKLSRWCNRQHIRKACAFTDYKRSAS